MYTLYDEYDWRPLNEDELAWYAKEARKNRISKLIVYSIGYMFLCLFGWLFLSTKIEFPITLFVVACLIVYVIISICFINHKGKKTPMIIYGECVNKLVKREGYGDDETKSYYITVSVNGENLSEDIHSSRHEFNKMALGSKVAVIKYGSHVRCYSVDTISSYLNNGVMMS
jgi:hypothetical protein